MVTDTQNRANLRSAERLVAEGLGLESADVNAMPYAQRVEFTRRLAELVLNYPARFTDATLATARGIVGRTYSPLDDTAFNWSDFAVAAAEASPAGALVDAGEGVKAAVSSLKWALPAGALAAGGILLLALARRTGAR